MTALNATHDPKLRSWVDSANEAGNDFPIQNLPFGRFRAAGSSEAFRIGVAIGDQVLDLRATGLVDTDDMNVLMNASVKDRQALRAAISAGLAEGSDKQAAWSKALLAQAKAEMTVPCRIGDYTDFYTGIHHATTIGKLFRPDQPLMPNYKWVPIGYHGRASSIVVSGQTFKRPQGQTKAPDAAEPSFGPSKRLDYELELGFLVGQGNALGEPIAIGEAEDHLFGVTLLNDWSARDLQAWEYQPLGPFLSKNFASTLSPWIVTTEALAPFRAKFERPAGDPQPLPYLDSPANRERGALDITLEVLLQTAKMRAEGVAPVRLTRGNTTEAAYWTAAQLIAHHTVNGCNLQPGDLLGSGTLSGPKPDEAGSLIELTLGGKQPITLPNGEKRTFLEDGDTLVIRGYCERVGAVRIGLGEVSGTVV
ncbi:MULTISPECIES: fumarylacetoacetase [Variovorax]|jgi:fumarylacetoacetase|uniref:fumarylacetoacetase n=1 Tax=Variovorax TaxID=34072 RepID=UPI00086CE4A8|nr:MULTISPECIES: fumarylacetoacetase [Variovorax]MBN8754253.1 fumarylacetoacetase [Variovorax sp.]ODU18547.1 MAG: fumarylacetoacetase [Variovorax sp. SCN 67-85]ODV25470.1 MAG: fumarylacetoacetase [Variovorax sp. SCN 67-20]OJZ05035.1 MAG: fumarylacetoacetase [Variovorax sp. 67-131]UKI09044.1 fumarylacetoacetase [Variovorax paradoxus]